MRHNGLAAGKIPERGIPDAVVGRNRPTRYIEEQTVESVRNAEGGSELELGTPIQHGASMADVAMGTTNSMGGCWYSCQWKWRERTLKWTTTQERMKPNRSDRWTARGLAVHPLETTR
jgi:hypothetical protein